MGDVPLTRRQLLAGGLGLGASLALDPTLLGGCTSSGGSTAPAPSASPTPVDSGVLDPHQLAVVEAATARLIPGPGDDPSETGHPGAREAGVTAYIAGLLGAFDLDPPRVYAGGPFSGRNGGDAAMSRFLPLPEPVTQAWRARIEQLQSCYRAGLAELDRRAGASPAASATTIAPSGFVEAPAEEQDRILAENPVVADLPAGFDGFTDLLFAHAIEGFYGAPEYGGNQDLVGWRDIGWPGDVQPQGYPDSEVSAPGDRTPLDPTAAVAAVVTLVSATAPAPLPPGTSASR